MNDRAGLVPIVLLAALLLAPAIVRADEPVATAPIPPPLPTPYVAPSTPAPKTAPAVAEPKPAAKETAKETPKDVSKEPPKKSTAAASHKPTERKIASAHRVARIKRNEHHPQLAHVAPAPRPPRHPHYYRDEMVPGPMAEAPPFPPPWYGRPFPGYPFGGPRGPMPW